MIKFLTERSIRGWALGLVLRLCSGHMHQRKVLCGQQPGASRRQKRGGVCLHRCRGRGRRFCSVTVEHFDRVCPSRRSNISLHPPQQLGVFSGWRTSHCHFLASYLSSLTPCSWTTFSFEEIYRIRFRGWSGFWWYQCIHTFFLKVLDFIWHSRNAVFPFFLVTDVTSCVMRLSPLISERKTKNFEIFQYEMLMLTKIVCLFSIKGKLGCDVYIYIFFLKNSR